MSGMSRLYLQKRCRVRKVPGAWLACAGLSLSFLSASTLANQWHAAVSVQSGQSDNGAKVAEQPIAERQDEYRLNIGGDYTQESLQAAVDYQVNERHFSEASQSSLTQLEGNSRLLLGSPSDTAELLVSHSRRSLLQEPGQITLTNNLDERDILAVAPGLRWRFAGVNRLLLTGDYSQVRFKQSSQRDSQRAGGQLQFERQLNQTDKLFILARQTEIEFDHVSDANYTYGNVALGYRVQLRQLDYQLQFGYNQRKTAHQPDEDAPFYDFTLNYQLASQRWQLVTSRYITDSSMGNGNNTVAEVLLNADSSDNLQQLDRQFLALRWFLSPCDLCDLSIYGQRTRDLYLQQGLHAQQLNLGAQASYQISRRQAISLRFDRNDQGFDGSNLGVNTQRKWWQLRYELQASRTAIMALLLEREDGRSGSGLNYRENYWGISLNYQLH